MKATLNGITKGNQATELCLKDLKNTAVVLLPKKITKGNHFNIYLSNIEVSHSENEDGDIFFLEEISGSILWLI